MKTKKVKAVIRGLFVGSLIIITSLNALKAIADCNSYAAVTEVTPFNYPGTSAPGWGDGSGCNSLCQGTCYVTILVSSCVIVGRD